MRPTLPFAKPAYAHPAGAAIERQLRRLYVRAAFLIVRPAPHGKRNASHQGAAAALIIAAIPTAALAEEFKKEQDCVAGAKVAGLCGT